METIETNVVAHYGKGDLLSRILKGLTTSGINLDNLEPIDLAPIEEFHIGGRAATEYAVSKLPLLSNDHVLDIGCGIGGAARYIASQIGCQVTGIDLTPEYIAVAKDLTARFNFTRQVQFNVANALSMPFDSASFDAAITLHVAMNISNRKLLYSETARVLKPGATLCIFDVMKNNNENLIFPVPWAQSSATSFLATEKEMRDLLGEAGFHIKEVEDRTEFALDFFKQTIAASESEPKPLGIHLVIGEHAAIKLKNLVSNIKTGCVAPTQIIATRVMSR